jgi:hypothetical protein
VQPLLKKRGGGEVGARDRIKNKGLDVLFKKNPVFLLENSGAPQFLSEPFRKHVGVITKEAARVQ